MNFQQKKREREKKKNKDKFILKYKSKKSALLHCDLSEINEKYC